MIEENSIPDSMIKEAILYKALELLQRILWPDLEMIMLAQEMEISATQLYERIPHKADLLKGFVEIIDEKMRETYEASSQHSGITQQDQLFDIIMCRLEAIQPYKKAFKNLYCALWTTPFQTFETFPKFFNSLQKILEMASISTNGILGVIKIKAFAIVYGIILKEWLKEENSQPSDMMIEIDRLLKQIAPILRTG